MRASWIIFAFFILSACASNKPSASAQFDGCEPNESATHYLCLAESAPNKSGDKVITYSLYDKKGNLLVEGTLDRGTVKWLDDTAIEIFQIPGMPSTQLDNASITKVYDLSSATYMTKKDYLEK